MAAGAGPAHAVYFGCYETMKTAGLKVTGPRNISETFVHFGAGAVATVFHDAVMCPADGEIVRDTNSLGSHCELLQL